MRRLNRSILSGGVVYPAGQAATPELESAITNPAFWDDSEAAAPIQDAVPDDYPDYTDKPRPDGWENFSDDEKRAYVYGTDDVDPPVDPPVDYTTWDYDDLVALVKSRNGTRDEAQHIKPTSRRAEDLAASLAADDQVAAQP